MKRIGLFILAMFLFSSHKQLSADSMSNSSFRLDNSNTGDEVLSTPIPAQPQSKQTATMTDISSDAQSNNVFSISTSTTSLSFDTLYPTDPLLRSVSLSIQTGGRGATIFQRENHSLTNADGQIIPDTTCDSGICSSYTSGVWTNILTYGLGFRCMVGTSSCDSTNDETMYYRAANSGHHEFITPIERISDRSQENVTLTYKLNTSATQPDGRYQNTISYIIVPNY